MFRLTYISSPRGPITVQSVASILAASRANNARLGVTGLLVVGRNRFLQLLEGEEEVVRSLYAKIGADGRHFACVQLRAEHAVERLFPDWAMGGVGIGGASDPAAMDAARKLVDRIENPLVRAEFTSFLELHARAA